MPDAVVIYTVLHQPRRPRLPAPHLSHDLSPREMAEAIFDEPLNHRYFSKVARYCYHPAIEAFRRHVDAGLKLNVGLSFSFLQQAQRWDPNLFESLSRLAAHPNVEIIGVEPYHSFLFWLDIRHFVRRMQWMRAEVKRLFGKRPEVTDTTEMILTPEIYTALQSAGFRAVLTEGRKQFLDWRSPGYVYTAPGGRLRILPRHNTLSDDVGYRFSNRQWDGYPLLASDYVRWLRDSDGDFVLLGWDFETFGEHHPIDSGIFDFLNWLPGELAHQGVRSLTASEALDSFQGRVEPIELPASPITWAGEGHMGFFLGNPIQQRLFHLMRHAYHLCSLSDDPELLDIALWLAQSDNLHLLQWFEEWGSTAEVSAYFTPDEWWGMGGDRMLAELQRSYANFVEVVSERLARRSRAVRPREAPEVEPKQRERPARAAAPVAALVSRPAS